MWGIGRRWRAPPPSSDGCLGRESVYWDMCGMTLECVCQVRLLALCKQYIDNKPSHMLFKNERSKHVSKMNAHNENCVEKISHIKFFSVKTFSAFHQKIFFLKVSVFPVFINWSWVHCPTPAFCISAVGEQTVDKDPVPPTLLCLFLQVRYWVKT